MFTLTWRKMILFDACYSNGFRPLTGSFAWGCWNFILFSYGLPGIIGDNIQKQRTKYNVQE